MSTRRKFFSLAAIGALFGVGAARNAAAATSGAGTITADGTMRSSIWVEESDTTVYVKTTASGKPFVIFQCDKSLVADHDDFVGFAVHDGRNLLKA